MRADGWGSGGTYWAGGNLRSKSVYRGKEKVREVGRGYLETQKLADMLAWNEASKMFGCCR